MPISDDMKADGYSATGPLPLVLLKIDHADISTPIRIVNNKVEIISNGETFNAFPFRISLPDNLEDAPPRAQLRIDNVSREIGEAIRSISTPADVTIQVVRQAALDHIEASWPAMRLTNARYDALTVRGDLEFEDLTREPYPAHTFSPAEFPGLVQ